MLQVSYKCLIYNYRPIHVCLSIIIQDILGSNCGQIWEWELARIFIPGGTWKTCFFMHHLSPVSTAAPQWIFVELIMGSRCKNFKVTLDMAPFPLTKRVELTSRNEYWLVCWASVHRGVRAMGANPGDGDVVGGPGEESLELDFQEVDIRCGTGEEGL